LPTPQIGHLTSDDYEHIYEPAEDSFIFLDALEEDADDLRQLQPDVCVEIGYVGFWNVTNRKAWIWDRISIPPGYLERRFCM
jgi:hypothetical protein